MTSQVTGTQSHPDQSEKRIDRQIEQNQSNYVITPA
jgi:hypothetical protein